MEEHALSERDWRGSEHRRDELASRCLFRGRLDRARPECITPMTNIATRACSRDGGGSNTRQDTHARVARVGAHSEDPAAGQPEQTTPQPASARREPQGAAHREQGGRERRHPLSAMNQWGDTVAKRESNSGRKRMADDGGLLPCGFSAKAGDQHQREPRTPPIGVVRVLCLEAAESRRLLCAEASPGKVPPCS